MKSPAHLLCSLRLFLIIFPQCYVFNYIREGLLKVAKLTENFHKDIGCRLSIHIRKVMNLTGVGSSIWWLHVAHYYWGIFGHAWRKGRLKPALVRSWNDILSWLIVIDLKANGNQSEHLSNQVIYFLVLFILEHGKNLAVIQQVCLGSLTENF